MHWILHMNKVKKFRNKYRITSPRIPWFDYGSNASYYITICTKDRKEFFGSIENREMLFSPIGRIVQDEWEKTPMIRPELNLIMDKYIIMPNHIHGIIVNTTESTNLVHKGTISHQLSGVLNHP